MQGSQIFPIFLNKNKLLPQLGSDKKKNIYLVLNSVDAIALNFYKNQIQFPSATRSSLSRL